MKIAFISTRLAGTDGVSLETQKLAVIARRLGHEVVYCAGELGVDMPGMLIPELHFRDPVAMELGERAFGGVDPDPDLEPAIRDRAAELKKPLRQFLQEHRVDYVIPQNIFAIPMQLPLAQALADLMQETGLPGLAHNHDFYWERERFLANRIPQFLDAYFPPALPMLRHAVINSLAQRDLRQRRGLESILLPNVFDFAVPAPGIDEYNADFRQAVGLSDEDWLILQPTRVVPRKGIELAIDLVSRLDDPRARLVITHHAGDEGMAYLHHLQKLAQDKGVDLRYVADRVDDNRRLLPDGTKVYSLWDSYPHADLITYPSFYEGFGNALIETIYFRKPAVVNRYSVYAADIGPLGFRFAEIDALTEDGRVKEDGVISGEVVNTVRHWLQNPAETQAIVERNYRLGQKYFSYQTLEAVLRPILRP